MTTRERMALRDANRAVNKPPMFTVPEWAAMLLTALLVCGFYWVLDYALEVTDHQAWEQQVRR